MGKTLSVVLAVFNEEKNLAACLNTIKDIADEIIIVDGTSTDKTVEIAKSFGAKVKITTNKLNFHINKQMAIDMATKDWILQLDADEHASKELKDEIREILKKDPEEFNGYWMPRKNLFLGRFLMKGGQYPDYTLRFYRTGKGRLPQKDVHEQAEVDGKVGYLKSALLHYPYESFAHYLRKWNKYNDLFAGQIKEEQKNKNIVQKIFYAFAYLILKPAHWFLTTYIRHKGFMDLWSGFVFSLFSALRFPASYIKYIGPYKFLSAVILVFAATLRLWNFPIRWGLGGDDGRDAMIGLEALRRHQLPLMGPFSSAGPFVFGGIYYWVIALSYAVLPFLVNAPWVMLEVMSILTVGLLMYLGKLAGGKKLSLIVGILAATSPQLIARALALGPHTFIATFSTATLICFLLLWQTKNKLYALLLGIFVGLSVSFHYQGINLLIFIPFLFFVTPLKLKDRIIAFFLSLFGFLIPSLPLLLWDSHQGFANLRNLMDYFFIAQYRIYVPNSWRIFIFNFIPWYWSFVVGRFYLLSFAVAILSALTVIGLFIKRKLKREVTILGLIFFILLFVSRFYKGERSEGYLLYFVPLILLFSGLFINYVVFNKQRILRIAGFIFLLLILIGNAVTIKNSYLTSPAVTYEKIANLLINKYPNSNFSLYIYKYKEYDPGMGLSLILDSKGKISSSGIPIGISCYGRGCFKEIKPIFKNGINLVDLSNVKKEDLKSGNKTWVNVNGPSVYDSLITWLNNNQLRSTFDLKVYIMEKVGKI